MKYIQTYNNYDQEMNEGLKNWVATLLMLANLGLVPPSITSASAQDKKEFVENQSQDKIDAAIFAKFMSDNGLTDAKSAYDIFIKNNSQVKTPFEDMNKYISKNGKQVLYNQNYVKNDYSNVDIHTFTPNNYVTDMGNFIPDEDEPKINNWISDYEKKTSVEIAVITVDNLNGEDIFDYSQNTFQRLHIGKKYTDDGVLLVFSMKDRKWRIHTGYGVEGTLTDGICSRIGNTIVKPYFKKGEYEAGIMAALEEIRSNIGDEGYELKKKSDLEREKHRDMEIQETISDVLGFLAISGIIGGIIGSIVYLRKRRRLKKEEREKALNKLKKTLNNIDQIVKSFPKSIDSNSNQLLKIYNDTKNIIRSVKTMDIQGEDKLKTEEINKIEDINNDLYVLLSRAVDKFNSYNDDVRRRSREIESISSLKMNAYSAINMGIEAAMEIKKLGYNSDIPNKEQVDKLDFYYNDIINLVSTDFDSASIKFGIYRQQIGEITTNSNSIRTKLSSIKNSIHRVQNWRSEISKIEREFKNVANQSEKSKFNDMILKFEDIVSKSKDFISLESELDSILSLMKRAIKRDSDEKEKKRQDEERERRRKREEEEEEDRRRRSSYSSSYYSSSSSSSSNDSFGGFGGGDSGGGGASGEW